MEDRFFQDIIDCLQDGLPEEWEKVIFYSDYFQGSYSMKYYVQGKNGKYVDCFSLQGISKNQLFDLFRKIDKIILPVRETLNDKEKWSVMTMKVEKSGKFKADYDYTDFPDGTISYEREWKNKYLV